MRFPFLAGVLLAASPIRLPAQRVPAEAVVTGDTTLAHTVRLRDGSTLIGRLVEVTADSVRIQLRSAALTLPRTDIAEIRQFPRSRLRGVEYWPENPGASRLLFATTAFPMEEGETQYSNLWLFIHGVSVGITERITVSGGLTTIPGIALQDNLFYVAPKLTVIDVEGAAVAVGGLLGWAPAIDNDDGFSDNSTGGIFYGVSSFGSRDSNLSLGLGWWYGGGEVSSRPLGMVGGQWRTSRRLSLISENWLSTQNGVVGVVSYGLRFLGERLSADLAFINVTEAMIFPGVPWLSIAVRF